MKLGSHTPGRGHGNGWLSFARTFFLIFGSTLLVGSSRAGDMYTNSPHPGGVAAQAAITATTLTPTNAIVCWYGMQGWYSVETSTNLSDWLSVGSGPASDHAWCVNVTNSAGRTNNVFFRLNQANGYVGSGGCSGCHAKQHNQWYGTRHASAFGSASAVTNFDLVSRTIGYGQPSGFTDITNTSHLANVGCENCHGPAGWHKYSDHDLIRPAVTVGAEVCGGCHTDAKHPTYPEWTTSRHAEVTEHVQEYFLDTNALVGLQRQMSCGTCHSAATRAALLNDYEARKNVTNVVGGVTNVIAGRTNYVTLPSAHDAAEFGQTCVSCHDPHRKYNEAQLRNPKFSTKFFTLPTSYVQTNVYSTNGAGAITTNSYFLNTVFATSYDAGVQTCGQCHNTRGADWTSSGRPPHHSAQYNMLIGAVQANYLNGTNVNAIIPGGFGRLVTAIGPHGLNTNGCAQCHMASTTLSAPTTANPNYTGHGFDMRLQGCKTSGCHSSTNQALGFMIGMQGEVAENIGTLVGLLNEWGTNKAPLITNAFAAYGQYAWEYTAAGEVSNPGGTNTFPGTTNVIVGPSASLQSRIPNTIKQARFNLYLVEYEGSYGVHNPDYTRFLLNHSISNVTHQLSQP